MVPLQSDPVENIPPPEEVRRMLTETVRRSDLLRALLRLARRKAAYTLPSQDKPTISNPKGVGK